MKRRGFLGAAAISPVAAQQAAKGMLGQLTVGEAAVGGLFRGVAGGPIPVAESMNDDEWRSRRVVDLRNQLRHHLQRGARLRAFKKREQWRLIEMRIDALKSVRPWMRHLMSVERMAQWEHDRYAKGLERQIWNILGADPATEDDEWYEN